MCRLSQLFQKIGGAIGVACYEPGPSELEEPPTHVVHEMRRGQVDSETPQLCGSVVTAPMTRTQSSVFQGPSDVLVGARFCSREVPRPEFWVVGGVGERAIDRLLRRILFSRPGSGGQERVIEHHDPGPDLGDPKRSGGREGTDDLLLWLHHGTRNEVDTGFYRYGCVGKDAERLVRKTAEPLLHKLLKR